MGTFYNRGTSEEMLDAMKDRLEELSGDVESSSCDVSEKSEVLGSVLDMEEDERDRYLHNLIGTVEDQLPEYVESIIWDNDDTNLYMTVTSEDEVSEFEVPFEDLTQVEDEDARYILDSLAV